MSTHWTSSVCTVAVNSTHDALHCELLCACRPKQEHARSLRNYTPFRISNSRINIRKYSVLNICVSTFNTLYLTEPTCDIFIGANIFRPVIQNISMYIANVLACCISNVSIVWFYTLIIAIVLTVFIIYTYCSYILLSVLLLGLWTCWN